MKKTINFIKTILSKFNLITSLIANNLALHQQLVVLNRSIKRPQNQDQRSLVLDHSLSLLEKLAGFIDCFKTRNRCWLAQKRFPVVLALEIQIQKSRPSTN